MRWRNDITTRLLLQNEHLQRHQYTRLTGASKSGWLCERAALFLGSLRFFLEFLLQFLQFSLRGITPDAISIRILSEAKDLISRSPSQRHRPIHRMFRWPTRPPRLQQIRLQREIPFRRTIRIINQHQPRIMLQSLGLLDHRFLILPQKLSCESSKNRYRQKNIPGRHKINPAKIPSHRRHRRQARKPQMPAANLFQPHIRKHEINHRRRILP